MKLRKSLTAFIFAAAFVFSSCNRHAATNTSTSGALSANSAISGATTCLFERRVLDVKGFNNLTEFIRPDVRARLDHEPSGNNDEDGNVSPQAETEKTDDASSAEVPISEEQNPANNEDGPEKARELENAKFTWAKKKFGETIAANQGSSGVIILYADDAYYNIGSLIRFVEEGRDRIVTDSGVPAQQLQVVYGGYRGVAQVEFWLVPAGENLPDVKPESRDTSEGPEN